MNTNVDYRELIDLVLDGKVDSIKVPRLPLNTYISYLDMKLGTYDSYETNGYECDFWVEWIRYDYQQFQLSGDLWYDEEFEFSKV